MARSSQDASGPARNTDRPLMSSFNVEEEVAPPVAPNLLPDKVMAMYYKWDLFLDLVKQNLSYVRYLN